MILNSWYNYKSWILNEMGENDEDTLTFYRIKAIRDIDGKIIGIN